MSASSQSTFKKYLDKSAHCNRLIDDPPASDLQIVVVIPCYAEPTVEALPELFDCERPRGQVEVIILINQSASEVENIARLNQSLYEQVNKLTFPSEWLTMHLLHLNDLPPRQAGVGLARKIAMDEALRRFEAVGHDGLIINLDADCRIRSNYFVSIQDHFKQYPHSWSAGIHFEHDLSVVGDDHAIVEYEMHLRYYVQAQRWVGLPYARQTLGSCMVVRARAYARMGGMNRKQAGEDFYFLQKFIKIGRHLDIPTTTVLPSSRRSNRVPFGTGRAMIQIADGETQLTTSLIALLDLENWLAHVDDWFQADRGADTGTIEGSDQYPEPLAAFLEKVRWTDKREEIRQNVSSRNAFRQRFFQWFDPFLTMKYVHFCRRWYPDQPVIVEAGRFFEMVMNQKFEGSRRVLLDWYRRRALSLMP